MASLNEILALCREGQAQQAYELSRNDMRQQLPWAQREMGWALYYLMRDDTDTNNYQSLVEHLDEFSGLNQLTLTDDNIIFENVLFKVSGFVRDHISPTGVDSPEKLSSIFSKLRGYNFEPSRAYSFLLKTFIKCDRWQEMADFIDWWNLQKLREDDYMPYRTDNGRTIMSVAEQAFIAKSKALLRLNDHGRIEEFLPMMDELMEDHPEMTYPGYFYGKLLLSLDGTAEDALRVIIPFARKKATEFWVWQLLSDVFVDDQERQLACLLRAINCHTQDNFLVKVRIKLATLYIQQRRFNHAKHQIDRVTQCYLSQGWRLPYEVNCWSQQPWFTAARSIDTAPLDYMAITTNILYPESEEAIAVVVNVDRHSQRISLVYGPERRISQRLRINNVVPGIVLRINYVNEQDGRIRIIGFEQTELQDNLDYARMVEGTIIKRPDRDFAFIRTDGGDYFISPNVVRRFNLQNDETVRALLVYKYNRNRDRWDWSCISVNR